MLLRRSSLLTVLLALVVASSGCPGNDADGDGYAADVDCDDSDPAIHPDAAEVCDAVDNNCDEQVDEGLEVIAWYPDGDGDGFGVASTFEQTCASELAGHVTVFGDCDDGNAGVYPGAAEVCDGVDQNCDNAVDEGLPQTDFWIDADGDGYGRNTVNPTETTCEETVPGHVENNDDCNDGDDAVSPVAEEVCDGADNNCDNQIDEGHERTTRYRDFDGDGFGSGAGELVCGDPTGWSDNAFDCNDSAANINPEAEEVCDGADNNCDGEADEGLPVEDWYPDWDGDGFGVEGFSIRACEEPFTYYGSYATEVGDCNNYDASVSPGVDEACDGIDNDCDTEIDEGFDPDFYLPDFDGDGFGDPTAIPVIACEEVSGLTLDDSDCNDRDAAVNPEAVEICDGQDNDCNGLSDAAELECETTLPDEFPVGLDDVLNGATGFEIRGDADNALVGYHQLTTVGDINGDGLADLSVSPRNTYYYGASSAHIVFGAEAPTNADVDLSQADARAMSIRDSADRYGSRRSVAGIGDFNGDGIDDLLVVRSNGGPIALPAGPGSTGSSTDSSGGPPGAGSGPAGPGGPIGPGPDPGPGAGALEAYVVFGGPDLPRELILDELEEDQALALTNLNGYGGGYGSVNAAGVGDINGDGLADLLLGPPYGTPLATYVVFGGTEAPGGVLDLTTLTAADGFTAPIPGAGYGGTLVGAPGDINGDGFDDMLVGRTASYAAPGSAFVVFGGMGGFGDELDLSALSGPDGFALEGAVGASYGPAPVFLPVDANGDGFDDLCVQVPAGYYGPSTPTRILLGSDSFGPSVDLASAGAGAVVELSGAGTYFTLAAEDAGDVNGDGLNDLLITEQAQIYSGTRENRAWVVFGSGTPAAEIDTSGLDGSDGFEILTESVGAAGAYALRSASAAGDIDGDGFDDLLVGDGFVGVNYSGQAALIFGQASWDATLDVGTLTEDEAVLFEGANYSATGFRTGAADMTGDGIPDLLIGAPTHDYTGGQRGSVYVVFGHALPDAP